MSFLGSLAGLALGVPLGAIVGGKLTKKKRRQSSNSRNPNPDPISVLGGGNFQPGSFIPSDFTAPGFTPVNGGGQSFSNGSAYGGSIDRFLGPQRRASRNGGGRGFSQFDFLQNTGTRIGARQGRRTTRNRNLRPSPSPQFNLFDEAQFLRGLSPQAPQSNFVFDTSRARGGQNANLPYSPYYRSPASLRFPTGPVQGFPGFQGSAGAGTPNGSAIGNDTLTQLLALLRGLGGGGTSSAPSPAPTGISPIEAPTGIIAGGVNPTLPQQAPGSIPDTSFIPPIADTNAGANTTVGANQSGGKGSGAIGPVGISPIERSTGAIQAGFIPPAQSPGSVPDTAFIPQQAPGSIPATGFLPPIADLNGNISVGQNPIPNNLLEIINAQLLSQLGPSVFSPNTTKR